MSVTKFRGQPRPMPRIPNAAEDTVDNRLMSPSRRIARLEAELAESKREIERLRAELQSTTDDGERAALREIWQQSPAGPAPQGFTLWRWLRSQI